MSDQLNAGDFVMFELPSPTASPSTLRAWIKRAEQWPRTEDSAPEIDAAIETVKSWIES